MKQEESSTTSAGAILNAAWWVRHYSRPGQERQRARALERVAVETLRALSAGREAESILYAVAAGLYQRGDPRFV